MTAINPDHKTSDFRSTRARVALAESEVGLSEEELTEMYFENSWFNEGATPREFMSIARAVLARFGRCVPAPVSRAEPSDEQIAELAAECLGYENIPRDCDGGAVEAYQSELIFFARELFARFGTTPPSPVPSPMTHNPQEIAALLTELAEYVELDIRIAGYEPNPDGLVFRAKAIAAELTMQAAEATE